MLRPNAAAAATQRTNLTQRITVGGTLTTVTTTIRYQRAGDKLVAFGGQLAKHPRQRLTFLDSSTGQWLRVRTDRTGHFQTRLNASHPYEVSGAGGSFAVEPSSIGMRVTQQRGLTVTPATIASNHITTTLKPAVQELPTGTRHPTVNAARKTVTVPGLRADLRQGDLVIVPPTGYYYGGIAIRVTSIQRNPQADTTTLGVAQPTLKQVVNTVIGSNTVNTERAVFIPSVPSATTGTAVSQAGMQKTGWLTYDDTKSLELSSKLEFDLAPLIKGLATTHPNLKPLANHVDGSLTLEVKDTMDTNLDLNLGWKKHAKLKVTNTMSRNEKFEATWPKKNEKGDRPELTLKSIPLGTVPIPVGGGVSVDLVLELTITASGTVTINYTHDTHHSDTVSFDSSRKKKLTSSSQDDVTNSLGFKLEGELKAGVGGETELKVLHLPTLTVTPEAGAKAVGTFSGEFDDNQLTPDGKTGEKSLTLKKYAQLEIEVPVAKWFGGDLTWTPLSKEVTIAKWNIGQAETKPKPKSKHSNSKMLTFPKSYQRDWSLKLTNGNYQEYQPVTITADDFSLQASGGAIHASSEYTAAEKAWLKAGGQGDYPSVERQFWGTLTKAKDGQGRTWYRFHHWYDPGSSQDFMIRLTTAKTKAGKQVPELIITNSQYKNEMHAYTTEAVGRSVP